MTALNSVPGDDRRGHCGAGEVNVPFDVVTVNGVGEVDVAVPVEDVDLESVQQSRYGSQLAFWHFNLQIEVQIGTQMRRKDCHSPFETHFEHLKIED